WRVGVSKSSDLHSERRGFSKFQRQKQVPGISEFPSSNASVGYCQSSDISNLSGSQ
ncbi:hypothetical protein KI387_017562, partial [Taxus chinensis]